MHTRRIYTLHLVYRCALWLLIFTGISCKDYRDQKTLTPSEDEKLTFNIDKGTTFQSIEHFGASDAWSIQFVGKWPEVKKNRIADLLFSLEYKENGDPKGIGLSIWRYNLGAGSAHQKDKSGIKDRWRRAESFLNTETNLYDWNSMQGQVWFARAAKKRGVEKLLVFANSPPVNITRNGLAFPDQPGESNLIQENYGDYAQYLANVVLGLKDLGLEVDYVSPINEPQWDWENGTQEGTSFRNDEIAELVKTINAEWEKRNISSLIDIPEAAKLNYLYEHADREGRANQIHSFYDKSSPNYIGDLHNLSRSISGHSYFTTAPKSELVKIREELANNIKEMGDLRFWMSEYCILGDNAGIINGSGRDLGMEPALYMAGVIHTDLSVANATAWHWWLAVSPYDYKDGLIYIDKKEENGAYYESKMLWALGNYSRFIRPGSQRISISTLNKTTGLMASAYWNDKEKKVVAVIVNPENDNREIELKENNYPVNHTVEGYITSEEYNLKSISWSSGEAILIPGKAVVTLII